ncbi:hypothetical protein HZA57_09070 [Candidatus Poribacteria bacterium]|nr:hypothetical protein [Candidatus Poribacteria bacterium]
MTQQSPVVPVLADLLAESACTAEFRAAAEEFASRQNTNGRIAFNRGCPPVKVLRVLCQLLETRPELAIERAEIEAESGCSDFRGTLRVTEGGCTHVIRFVWDCAWKAREMGWKTFWGDPDQQRAAREFGFRCFEVFEDVAR